MTKQEHANQIAFYNRDQKTSYIITQIEQRTGSSRPYAGTLYRKAKVVVKHMLATLPSIMIDDGERRVYVGDYVEFKSDIEQCGKLVAIKGRELHLENEDGFSGDYLRYATHTTETADRCW